VASSAFTKLLPRVRALIEANRVETTRGRYTRPAPQTYPHQWLWDSCFHAILGDLVGERAFAHDELRALFRAQEADGPDAGRLPHMTLLGADEDEAARDPAVREAYERDVRLWGNPRASTITQPPIVAEAVRRVGDLALWRELWTPMCRYYDWWLARRDPDGDGLYAAWHLWECGQDATRRGDPACARLLATGRTPRALETQTVNPTAKKRGDLLVARFLMLEDLQAIDDAERTGGLDEDEAQQRRTRLFGHEAIDLQAYLVENLGELATMGEALGEHDASARYRAAARRIVVAANAKLWDDEAGFYFDRWGEPEEVLRVRTPAAFVALYAGDLVPEERARRLLGHLLDPAAFWTRWPLPSLARDEPTFDPDEYWRGSTWVNVNWFVVRGLVRSASRFSDDRYLAPARELARRTVDLVSEAGFREFYRAGAAAAIDDPRSTAAGFGPDHFSWSGLVLDLARALDAELG
jgi:hypothetical protein